MLPFGACRIKNRVRAEHLVNRLVKRGFLGSHKVRGGVQRFLNLVFHLIAHHALTRLQKRHVLFQTCDIQLQRLKGHRQTLIAEIEILSGVLRVVEQLMRGRTQRVERGIGIGGVNQFPYRLLEERIFPEQIGRMSDMVDIVQVRRTPATSECGFGKILHPGLLLMIRQSSMRT